MGGGRGESRRGKRDGAEVNMPAAAWQEHDSSAEKGRAGMGAERDAALARTERQEAKGHGPSISAGSGMLRQLEMVGISPLGPCR